MDIKLVKGYRYLFHYKDKKRKFRANFIDIITRADGYKTLRVEKYSYESDTILMSGIITMPFSWINKIETLVDIVNNSNNTGPFQSDNVKKIAHVSDVLLEIDSFM